MVVVAFSAVKCFGIRLNFIFNSNGNKYLLIYLPSCLTCTTDNYLNIRLRNNFCDLYLSVLLIAYGDGLN